MLADCLDAVIGISNCFQRDQLGNCLMVLFTEQRVAKLGMEKFCTEEFMFGF